MSGLLILVGAAAALELADEPVEAAFYAAATTSRAAFNGEVGPGTTQLFGAALGATLPFRVEESVSLHVRLEAGGQVGPPPSELRERLPEGYTTGPYLGGAHWVAAMATSGHGTGPYLEVGGLLTMPAAWHPEFDRFQVLPGVAAGARLAFDNGLLLDAALRTTTPETKPGGSSFPVQGALAIGAVVP